eukprot:scpid89736/ scgid2828/ RecQ-mediated genome instability protein 1; BLM-associated protein of 75 kDa; FAAP75
MAHLNDAVKSYLRSSQKFCFHDQWLEDCIDWAKESFGEQASSARGLQDLVREQWLLGDLRDISPGCLPAWLPQSQVGVLSGTYALQVNQAVDVGASAYSQLEKLKGKEIIEEEQNDNKPSKKGWEEKPKASRLLMLELTDGIHTVRGMEHHPIPCLSTAISPGCKVLPYALSPLAEFFDHLIMLKSFSYSSNATIILRLESGDIRSQRKSLF